MASLNTRCRDILMLLLRSQTSLTLAEIASRLDVTPRMVRYSLSDIDEWLQEKEIQVIREPGLGTLVDAPAWAKRDLIQELESSADYDLLLSPWERLHVLAFSLLMSEQPLIVRQFESRLGVSRPTVLKDMDRAEVWLGKHNLSLIRRPGVGFKVVGRERHWREAVVSCLLDAVGEMPLLALRSGSQATFQSQMEDKSALLRVFHEFLDSLALAYCSRLVDSMERQLQLEFADNACVALVLHLAVLIVRVGQGKPARLAPDLVDMLRQQREFAASRMAVEQIAQRFEIAPTSSEVAHIAMQLLGAKSTRSISDITGEGEAERIGPEVLEIVDALLAEASILLHPCLRVDEQLIRSLTFHLQPALNRLRFDLPIRNPLLEDVGRRYPYIVEVARRSSAVLRAKVGSTVPDEEICYIAMHLGAAMERLRSSSALRKRVLVVCAEGVATAWLLVSRIQAEFPEIEVVEVMSASEVCKRHTFPGDVDAMISTVPLHIAGLPIIVVSPLLGVRDRDNISKALNIGTYAPEAVRSRDQAVGVSLAGLITAEMIGLQVPVDDWRQVVDAVGYLLLRAGAIEARYIAAMKEIIVQYGPYVVIRPGVALLHARPEAGVRRLCMSLVTMREPVEFGHPHNDPVGVAIAFGAVDDRSHLRALAQLARILGDQAIVNRIGIATTRSEILEIISGESQIVRPPPCFAGSIECDAEDSKDLSQA